MRLHPAYYGIDAMNRSRTPYLSLALAGLTTLASAAPTTLSAAVDDQYEENDTCAEAFEIAVPIGSAGLTITFTSSGPMSSGGADEDWFKFDVPVGHRCWVTSLGQFPGSPNFDMFLYRDDAAGTPCGELIDSTFVASGQVLEGQNLGNTPETYYVQFLPDNPQFEMENLSMRVRIVPLEQCSLVPADAFEPNETAALAADMPYGIYRRLTLTDASPIDFFRVAIPSGEGLRIGFASRGSFGSSATCYIYDEPGLVNLSTILGHDGLETYTNTRPFDSVIVRIERSSGSVTCEEYDLYVDLVTTPCSGRLQDRFDLPVNDFRSAATPITRDYYGDLRLVGNDRDWYHIPVEPGFGARVTVEQYAGDDIETSIYSEGQSDVFLWQVTNGAPAVYAWGAEAGGGTQSFDLLVERDDDPFIPIGCANYSINLEVFRELDTTHYCDGDTHQGSGPTSLRVFGSEDAADDALWISGRNTLGLESRVVVFAGFVGNPVPVAAMGSPCAVGPYTRLRGHTTPNDRFDAVVGTQDLNDFTGSTFVLQAWTNHAFTQLYSDAVTFTLQ